ncbi:MAG: radical SAM protein [Bacteroidetes bacterium]|nr:MAG: radical SAM protein [Bacteroidota bacterium]
MSTFLFNDIIFGPISSRRLGRSLGINLLPDNRKICNFNCIYCECGWTENTSFEKLTFHPRKEVYKALKTKLIKLVSANNQPDVITFAGNGEPTIHPDFDAIIEDTLEIRNSISPETQIAVLSNATMIQKSSVFKALSKIERNILKLDSAIEDTLVKINQPKGKINLAKLISDMQSFNGNLIIQTLFLRGDYKGNKIDNTTEEEINAWLKLLKLIQPFEVMIYTFHRDTPARGLIRISEEELNIIGRKVEKEGIKILVSP